MIYAIMERQECKSIWKARWFLSFNFRFASSGQHFRGIIAQRFPRCSKQRGEVSRDERDAVIYTMEKRGWAAPVLPNEPTNCFEPRADLPWETWNDPWMCTYANMPSKSAIIIISRRSVFEELPRIRVPIEIYFFKSRREISHENKKLISPIISDKQVI